MDTRHKTQDTRPCKLSQAPIMTVPFCFYFLHPQREHKFVANFSFFQSVEPLCGHIVTIIFKIIIMSRNTGQIYLENQWLFRGLDSWLNTILKCSQLVFCMVIHILSEIFLTLSRCAPVWHTIWIRSFQTEWDRAWVGNSTQPFQMKLWTQIRAWNTAEIYCGLILVEILGHFCRLRKGDRERNGNLIAVIK